MCSSVTNVRDSDVYRKVLNVEEYYRRQLSAIQGMGNVTTVLSPLSSKTLSLGMLLAAVERSLPVCHVEPGTYQIETDELGHLIGDIARGPTEIWLAESPMRHDSQGCRQLSCTGSWRC